MNGELMRSGTLSRKWYDAFVNQSRKEHYVEIGRCQVGDPGVWVYMNGSCYVVRLYNIGLNKEQVMENYKITKEWHDFISKSKSVDR